VALRGLEGSVEPGIEDLDGGVWGGGHARDGEDVGFVDGAGIGGFLKGKAGSSPRRVRPSPRAPNLIRPKKILFE
jgi:hypothetical protein